MIHLIKYFPPEAQLSHGGIKVRGQESIVWMKGYHIGGEMQKQPLEEREPCILRGVCLKVVAPDKEAQKEVRLGNGDIKAWTEGNKA
jgi:hypothetical protein